MSIYLFTGNGAGKTTNALGLAMRSLGQEHVVSMIQYMKGRKNIGEYKIQRYLKKFHVYQFGSKNFVNLKHPSQKDISSANKGLLSIPQIIKKDKPKLLILDEINIALAYGLLNLDETIKILKEIPPSIDVVITGRKAPKKLMNLADYVNEINIKKMPRKYEYKKGIQY